ncbi:MAG: hypothetical protein EBT45_08985 [Alphaproteobacteria bacterium]|nr:hypothetical protein [Alphaproteobacteria bacterium]
MDFMVITGLREVPDETMSSPVKEGAISYRFVRINLMLLRVNCDYRDCRLDVAS